MQSKIHKAIIKAGSYKRHFGYRKNSWDENYEFPSFDNLHEVFPEAVVIDVFQEHTQYPNFHFMADGKQVLTHVTNDYKYVVFFKERG